MSTFNTNTKDLIETIMMSKYNTSQTENYSFKSKELTVQQFKNIHYAIVNN